MFMMLLLQESNKFNKLTLSLVSCYAFCWLSLVLCSAAIFIRCHFSERVRNGFEMESSEVIADSPMDRSR